MFKIANFFSVKRAVRGFYGFSKGKSKTGIGNNYIKLMYSAEECKSNDFGIREEYDNIIK